MTLRFINCTCVLHTLHYFLVIAHITYITFIAYNTLLYYHIQCLLQYYTYYIHYFLVTISNIINVHINNISLLNIQSLLKILITSSVSQVYCYLSVLAGIYRNIKDLMYVCYVTYIFV